MQGWWGNEATPWRMIVDEETGETLMSEGSLLTLHVIFAPR